MRFKSFLSRFVFTNVLRYIRIFPNNDPVMACMLPEPRKNILHAAIFAFSAMAFFDLITMHLGIWTLVTSSTYAGLAVLFGLLFKRMKSVRFMHYISFSTLGVLIFDFITGPCLSTFMFHQPLWFSVLGQVPFTLFHLVSAVSFTAVIVPFLDLDVREELAKSKFFSFFTDLNWGRFNGFK